MVNTMVIEPVFPFYIQHQPLAPVEAARPWAVLMAIATILRSGAGARQLHFEHFRW
jgi:hypothetical protein